MQLALEAVLDIGRNIIALERLPKPSDNDEMFAILAEADILSDDLAEKMVGMGGARNIFVHGYLAVDQDQIYSNLEKLMDFEDFAVEIKDYLKDKLD